MLFLTFATIALVCAAVHYSRRVRADETPITPTWEFPTPCYVCAGRLTTVGHYVGGGKVCCSSCYEIITHSATLESA